MDIPKQPGHEDEPVLSVVHAECEGEVATQIAVHDGRIVRSGICLGCGMAGELTVV